MTHLISWPVVIGKLVDKTDLTRADAAWAMEQIMSGEATEVQMASFMVALRSKGESVDELAGLVDVMLANCLQLETSNDALDIVGTGGDQAGTVNVSSMASILAAAAGIPVMKHGSRSASGRTGSSEMLEKLGVRLDLTPERVAEVFTQVGLTFFFAPVFHPAMRHVAPVRKAVGIPTTFNVLGPLSNPVQPVATSLGVANEKLAPLLAAEMAARGRTALVFRGFDGLDELTTTANSKIWQVSGGEVRTFELDPQTLGLSRASSDDLIGGDAEHNAQVAMDLFSGKGSQRVRDIVLLNAAGGVVAYQLAKNPELAHTDLIARFIDALALVREALESGAALTKLTEWVTATNK